MNEGSNLEMPFLNLYSIEIYSRQQAIFRIKVIFIKISSGYEYEVKKMCFHETYVLSIH